MDLKDDENSLKFRQHPHITRRYYESSAGHVFVNNVNPFNTVGGHAGDAKDNLMNKRKNEGFIDVFDHSPTRQLNNSPSKELVDEIMKNYPFNENIFVNDQYDEIQEAYMATQSLYAKPSVSMTTNVYDTQYVTSCSRDVPQTSHYDRQVRFEEYAEDNNRHRAFSTNEMCSDYLVDRKGQCEKTTYCRPLINMYNQEFVYKTIQRNVRLQKLVKKLVMAREREKQREAWNNYINDLKNKHKYYSNEPSRISPQYVPGEPNSPEMMDDCYNTRFNWRQSEPCQHLLQDLYGMKENTTPDKYNKYTHDNSLLQDDESYSYDNNNLCYPTCSQASLLRWNIARQNNNFAYEWRVRPAGRFFRGNTIHVEKERNTLFDKIQGTTRPKYHCTHTTKSCKCKSKMCSIIRSKSVQVQTDNPPPFDLYFPYVKGAITGVKEKPKQNETDGSGLPTQESSNVPSNQRSSKSDKDINVPSKEGTKEPETQEGVKSNKFFFKKQKDVTGTPKQDLWKNKKDFTVPQKLDFWRNKKDASVSHKQEPSKIDKDVNVPDKQDASKSNKPFFSKEKKEKDASDNQKRESLKDKFKRVANNITKLKNKIRVPEEDARLKSLAAIEDKIDILMKSINSIMIDIKTKKSLLLNRSAAVSCAFISNSQSNLHRYRSDPYGILKNEEYVCGVVQNSSKSLTISEIGLSELKKHRESSISKIDKIMLEEMEKSDQVKKDIEGLLNLRNERHCSVQITFDIPTKEISTEVTDSLSKARLESVSKALMESNVLVEDLNTQGPMDHGDTQITIAVNTDPLGFLALLRISTDTVKQLLSYVPNLNYNNYLSMLLLPQRRCLPHYICNICGAAFSRPSQLSDHIEHHNLGRTRNCCVCRHTLDMQRHLGLFACRHCGQRFTRAYCCELHQQKCARELGRNNDVTSSHILLR